MSTWKFPRDLPVSKLKPIFGMVRTSAIPALCKMVVFPAQSKPSIKTFISLVPVSCAQVLAICAPIARNYKKFCTVPHWHLRLWQNNSQSGLSTTATLHGLCKLAVSQCSTRFLQVQSETSWVNQPTKKPRPQDVPELVLFEQLQNETGDDRNLHQDLNFERPKETDYRIVIAKSEKFSKHNFRKAPSNSDIVRLSDPAPNLLQKMEAALRTGARWKAAPWCLSSGTSITSFPILVAYIMSRAVHVCIFPHKPLTCSPCVHIPPQTTQLQSTFEICSDTHTHTPRHLGDVEEVSTRFYESI